MSDVKDPAIKLFGKTIQLPSPSDCIQLHIDPPPPPSPSSPSPQHNSQPMLQQQQHSDKDPTVEADATEQDGAQPMMSEDPSYSSAISAVNNTSPDNDQSKAAPDNAQSKPAPDDNQSTAPVNDQNKAAPDDDQSAEKGQTETGDSQEKTLKKPDKILPCPRCNSMDTKFCYYNNYNVNQPRHFCKNCQRYWTAGGTMRNVAVGAGRRKNKYSASHYRQIALSEALQNAGVDIPNEIQHPGSKTNGTFLTFGSDSPLCESLDEFLKITGKSLVNGSQNGFQKSGEFSPSVSSKAKDNGDDHDHPSGSSVIASYSKNEIVAPSLQNLANQNGHSFSPVPCFPGALWPYPWNVSQWNAPGTQVPPPGFCSFPMPFYPASPYWGCNVPVPGPWNVQWNTPTSLSGNHTAAPSSGPNSPTLGKHSRDENMPSSSSCLDEGSPKENNLERCLWVPKTLRIDDPDEAAKSRIWETLGIKNEMAGDSDCGKGMFKAAFQTKDAEKCHYKSSSVLHANPAAMSRSQSFHEST